MPIRVQITKRGESVPYIDAKFYGAEAMHLETLREVLPRWTDKTQPYTAEPMRVHIMGGVLCPKFAVIVRRAYNRFAH